MPNYFDSCLYFSTNQLARHLNALATKAFADIDITPTQGFTLLLINEKDVHSPCVLAKEMGMKPSTITRFLDTLEEKNYIKRSYLKRNTYVDITEIGKTKLSHIQTNWQNLHNMYFDILGDNFASKLTKNISKANTILTDQKKKEKGA